MKMKVQVVNGRVCFTILYLSFVCYSLDDAVIMRAHSSRMAGSRQLVVVLLVVFQFSHCVYQ